MATEIEGVILMGLEVVADMASDVGADAAASGDAATSREAHLNGEIAIAVRALAERYGLPAILDALRDAGDSAADAHDPAPIARELRSFSQSMANAIKAVDS